ncbi:MAG: hydantoinase/oxoprolinase family protein [Proteobacteria bacterium]|nr:hydantoinase/oxoprolinase family protein [Pseudomonadota bacterium]
MGMLINIDNGGTLTDICVVDGANVRRVKTLTTPHDLSRCFIDGLVKASRVVFGKEDLTSLLLATDHIRYSSTQGTNALVERKGPRLGVIFSGELSATDFRRDPHDTELFDVIVGKRFATLDTSLAGNQFEVAAVRTVNQLASAGASRIVVVHGGAERTQQEQRIRSVLLRKFPQHLLGAVPILYSHEVVEDENDVRRAWTTIFNAFLHPAMEHFLYNAEHKLRAFKAKNPLLIFRNDGDSARVAKTIAIKTYSSGPRGGMEGAKAIAAHYGFKHLLSMDIGGTTTDIGEVRDGSVRTDLRGRVEGVEVSFPLANVVSVGVGGSSIIKAVEGKIKVGPQSVGSAPGPACFGLGGTQATITDAFLLSGLLDPASYFGGEMNIDRERAAAAVAKNVAEPLGLSQDAAVAAMERAWVEQVVTNLKAFTSITPDTTLAAFGGAGPFVVCAVAEAAGIKRVLIPGLAAVFSAFGVGFSDIGHRYELPLQAATDQALKGCVDELLQRAQRGMFAEGFEWQECVVEKALQVSHGEKDETRPLPNGHLPQGLPAGAQLSVALSVTRPIPRPVLIGHFGAKSIPAASKKQRRILHAGKFSEVPLYQAEEQRSGAAAQGLAVLEEAYYTSRIDPGWRFEFSDSGDILLTRV